MNLFDELVNEALKNQPTLSTLRVVVEKELLHHDILRTLSQNNLLKDLTFIGGTCLRACYGGNRLSEDLDFTGGNDFTRESLSHMGEVLTSTLSEKYGLTVQVKDPVKDISNVDTWKIKVETRPKQKHFSAQRINREEIYTDKLLAFALRPNRLKHRNLWDMVWLHQQGIKPRFELIPKKLKDRHLEKQVFLDKFHERQSLVAEDKTLEVDFKKEMQRFLPLAQVKKIIEDNDIWSFIIYLIDDLGKQIDTI